MAKLSLDLTPIIKAERKKALEACARIAPIGSVKLHPPAPHFAGKRKQQNEHKGQERLNQEREPQTVMPHKTISDYWSRAQPGSFGFTDLVGHAPFLVQYLPDKNDLKFIPIQAVEENLHNFGSIGDRIMVITPNENILVPPMTRVHWRDMR